MKIIVIFSCSGMFRDVPECSGMFRNVPCSGFYRRPFRTDIFRKLTLGAPAILREPISVGIERASLAKPIGHIVPIVFFHMKRNDHPLNYIWRKALN